MKQKSFWKKFNMAFPWILIFFFLFVFPRFQGQIMPPIKAWVDSLGVLAPVGYILIGFVSVVVAPIGLGPINTVLQKAFGFWPSVLYFTIYSILGFCVNFWISKRFGPGLLKKFFPTVELEAKNEIRMKDLQNPLFGISFIYGHFAKVMETLNWKNFVIYAGGGDELLSYLHGTTKAKFKDFLKVICIVQPFNSMIFVTRNLAAGENNWLYTALLGFEIVMVYVPIVILFWDDIKGVFGRWKSEYPKFNLAYKSLETEYKAESISKQEFKTRHDTMSNKFLAKVFGIKE
jgi:uncharacterized membrane protein YdjX (TVP38/TMEM64 family)